MTWRAVKLQNDTQRPRHSHPPSASLSGREDGGGEGGERGGILPKSLKSGSGPHRLDVCGSSNGRRKLA